jgi:hypothetical protein
MENEISPKYQMFLVDKIEKAIWDEFQSYQKVEFYIAKWHQEEHEWNNNWENFKIERKEENKINLLPTLHNMHGELLLKIAIDLGIETPDFIPSIPTFRNEIKSNYPTASLAFEKAFKDIEEHPDIAIGLANSALESIIKEILKNDSIQNKVSSNKTLYDLTGAILKELSLFPNSDMPQEIKTIGSSLLGVSQKIEELRSGKTKFHGKTEDDYLINDPIYTYFIVNSVATVGLFLMSFYKKKYQAEQVEQFDIDSDEIPF